KRRIRPLPSVLMADSFSASRRRRWPWVLLALLLAGAGLWAGGWHYAAARAERTIAAWKEREARSGRIHTCGNESITGFPLRIVVRCVDATAQIRADRPIALAATEIAIKADVLEPTALNSEIVGPLTIGMPGQP